jgi:hypothetical protein
MAKGPSNKYVCERVRHLGCEEHNCEQERKSAPSERIPTASISCWRSCDQPGAS